MKEIGEMNVLNLKGMEFESVVAKIILIIARNGNKLVTTIPSLAKLLEEDESKIRKELIYMSKQNLIGMRLFDCTFKVKDIEVKAKCLELNIKQYTHSIISIGGSDLFYKGKVNEIRAISNRKY